MGRICAQPYGTGTRLSMKLGTGVKNHDQAEEAPGCGVEENAIFLCTIKFDPINVGQGLQNPDNRLAASYR